MAKTTPNQITLAVLQSQFARMQSDITDIKLRIDSRFVERDEYDQIKKDISNLYRLLWGVISIIATPVVLFLINAVLGLIIKK